MSYSLSFIGKYASLVLPVGVLIGLFLPFLAESFHSLLVLLTLSLVRTETPQLRKFFRRWQLVALLSAWILLIRPVTVLLVLQLFELPEPIIKAAIITAAAPPVTACGAIALYLGVDVVIAIVVTVATMLLVPLSLPLISYNLMGLQLKTGLWQVSVRLTLFIVTAFFIAALIKKRMGGARIHRNAARIDGISVICIGIFIIGIMHGVRDTFAQQPWYVFQVFCVSTLLVVSLYIFATILFWRLGPPTAMAIGLVSGNCNMGLMYLVLVDQVSMELLIFFSIGQIPMYFFPSLMVPMINMVLKRY